MEFEWSTFWSFVSAVATVLATGGIFYAARQLSFSAWIKAQEVFTGKEFTEARTKLFARFDDRDKPWTADEESNGLAVCRKMEELAALKRFVSKKIILREWGRPMARAWILLKPLVYQERKKSNWNKEGNKKWYAFEDLAEEALRQHPDLLG